MDDILGQMLLLGEDQGPFIEFIDYALWVCGSSLTVGVTEDNDISNSDSLGLSTPPPTTSLPVLEKILCPSPECPGNTEKPPVTDPGMTPMPPTESEPEPVPATDHELEPPTCTELEPATESTPEQGQVAAPVPRLEPITKSSEESGLVKQLSVPVRHLSLSSPLHSHHGWPEPT
ncbi:hypothetical protein PO909_004774 [Leuciscus waleckii]